VFTTNLRIFEKNDFNARIGAIAVAIVLLQHLAYFFQFLLSVKWYFLAVNKTLIPKFVIFAPVWRSVVYTFNGFPGSIASGLVWGARGFHHIWSKKLPSYTFYFNCSLMHCGVLYFGWTARALLVPYTRYFYLLDIKLSNRINRFKVSS